MGACLLEICQRSMRICGCFAEGGVVRRAGIHALADQLSAEARKGDHLPSLLGFLLAVVMKEERTMVRSSQLRLASWPAIPLILGMLLMQSESFADPTVLIPGYRIEVVALNAPSSSDIEVAPPSFAPFDGDIFTVANHYEGNVYRIDPTSGSSELFATGLTLGPSRMAFATGGAFGTSLYVSTNEGDPPNAFGGRIYAVSTAGSVARFGTPMPPIPWPCCGAVDIAFSLGGPFGTYLYSGSSGGEPGDSITRIPPTGGPTELFNAIGPPQNNVHDGAPTGLVFGNGIGNFGTDLYAAIFRTSGVTLGIPTGIYTLGPSGTRTPFLLGATGTGIEDYIGDLEFGPGGDFGHDLYATTDGWGGGIIRISDSSVATQIVRGSGTTPSGSGGGIRSVAFDGNTLYFSEYVSSATIYRLVRCADPSISGQVLADGLPLSGVMVTASSGGHSAVTNESGRYEIYGVADGPTDVTVVPPAGYEVITPAGGQSTAVVAACQTATQDFTLLGLGTISGVVSGDGSPLANVTVTLSASGGHTAVTQTSANGAYSFQAVPSGSAQVSVLIPAGYEADSPPGGTAVVAAAAGQTVTQDFSLVGFGDISGVVLAGGAPLANVTVDLVSSSDQIEFAATAPDGSYGFAHVAAGDAVVSIVVPLGYAAVDPEGGTATVSVTAGQTAVRNFTLEPLPDAGPARTIGYWKHQTNVYMSNRGTAQETQADMSTTYPARIFDHFYSNQLNSIDVQDVTFLPGPVPMTLEAMHETLNLRNASMLERAKQQYMALLLNVASNRLQSLAVVSADGGTVSQAVQQIAAQIKDGNPSNDEAAKDLADTINNGASVNSGAIDLQIPVIPFAPHPAQSPGLAVLNRATPNPMTRTVTIGFEVQEAGPVRVAVYDATGRCLRTLLAEGVRAGMQQAMWDGTRDDGGVVPNGIYFYRIEMPDRIVTSKFVVMR
jgi:hypothetical protein